MNVALLGFGTVGKGVYDIISNELNDIHIKAILVKHQEQHEHIKDLLVSDIETIIEDRSIDCVIEVIGGIDTAYDYIKRALMHKKHVVTANKAVVSKYFYELNELASKYQVSFRFEASVGGGINIIDSLLKVSKYNHINHIEGIINGATNFILSKVFIENETIEDALLKAKSLGYIEQDPKDDLEGMDLARKMHILSMIAYQRPINDQDINITSFLSITQSMIDEAKLKQQVIKYVGLSTLHEKTLKIEVKPIIVDQGHLYQHINYEENIIIIQGKYHQKQAFIGQGAGRYPTANAIVYDLFKIKG